VTDERSPSGRLAFDRLDLRAMPGFEAGGFTLAGLSPGVNVVHGPNASGKTTTAAAIRALLWPEAGGRESLAAVLSLDGERWEVDLDHGRVRWRCEGAESPPPPLPPADTADRYGLALHDLLQAGARGLELAAAVAREAAGGYDLEAARRAVGAKPRASLPRSLREAYETAAAEVRRIEDEQRRIVREAEDLARLEAELAAARRARARLARVEAAIEWSRCRARLEEAEEALRVLPAAVARLTGEEAERLAELDRRLNGARADRERAEAERAEEQRRLAATGLPEDGLPEGVAGALAARREELAALEREIDRAERELAAAVRRRQEARRELGDEVADEALAALRPADWRPVLELARRGDALRAEAAWIDGAEAPAGEPPPLAELDRRLELLAEAARALRRWLREPGADWRRQLPAWAGAAVLATAGAAGGLALDPRLWLLAAAGGLVALWSWLAARSRGRRRSFLEEDYRRLEASGELPAPHPALAWRPEPVAGRLEVLEGAAVEVRAERERSRRESERRRELEARRGRLAASRAGLDEERRRLVAELGLAPSLADADPAPLAALVHALGRWREANEEAAAREGYLERARAQHGEALEAVRREVAGFGGGEVTDAASARGEIDAVLARGEAHRLAGERLARLDGAGGELLRAAAEIQRIEVDRARLFARLDLEDGDEAGLGALLAGLGAYREGSRAVGEARGALQVAAVGMSRDPGGEDQELRERALDELLDQRPGLAAAAEREEELIRRVQDLRTRIGEAKRRHALEEALARREATAAALRRDRDENAGAVVAWELAEWLRERSRSRHQPAVMRRTAELFARITGGRFRLVAPGGDPPVFRAVETAVERTRGLDELSSARRLQLLVAVRMGFVEEQERGLRPPLVLDETLANSDEASAAALIEAVLELAREGRQVFYFTAQDDEVSKWRSALEAAAEAGSGPEWRAIDLLAERRLEAERRAPRRRWRPEPSPPPAPEGRSREQYAELLGVPGIDPRGEPGAVHLWYLVAESEVLHRLLARGLERWGELRAIAEATGRSGLLGEDGEAERRWRRARARAHCIELLCRSWRQGRGRPVDRGALVASGAVSEKFLEQVCALAEELDGAAAALVEALRGGGVARFQKGKVERLEEYLTAEGYLDGRKPLDEAALREAALRELAAEIAEGHLTVREVDELLAQVLAAGPAGS
jgi:energy-coupling factor transporter ATP-binding protein EcfA2